MAYLLRVILLMMVGTVVRGDLAKDRAECGEKLVGLTPCLTYLQGSAAAPTPDCCSEFRSIIGGSPKCLCVVLKDRDDPNLGIKINVTRALSLPRSCSAPVNISRCPQLLNLAPNSPEAQVFKNLTAAGTGSPSSASDHGTSSTASVHPSNAASLQPWHHYDHLVMSGRWWVGVEHSLFVGLLFLIAFGAA